MKYILGVDCAWTSKTGHLGFALIEYRQNAKAKLNHFGRSYEEFCSNEIRWNETVKGTAPDFDSLLQFCKSHGWDIDVIALDIPLSPNLITGRRSCDNEVSKTYGGLNHCAGRTQAYGFDNEKIWI